MTSAQSRLLRSSGNRAWLLTLLMACVLQSCFIFKPRDKPRVVTRPNKEIPSPKDTAEGKIDTFPPPPRFTFKDVYHISVLLPFSIDDQYITDFDYRNRTTPYRSMMALELYQGMKLALDELQGSDISFKVNVFDTKNSPGEVKRILTQPELLKCDVIIGPLFENSMKLVADFALRNEIYMLSPLSCLDTTGLPSNPYLICANASFESHISAIASHVHARYRYSNVLVARRDDPEEARTSELFTENLRNLNFWISPKEVVGTSWEMFPPGSFGPDTTIVFCPSLDEVFVNEVTRQLSELDRGYPVILFGLPGWLTKIESIRFDYLNQLNFHMTSNLWIDESSAHALDLAQRYREKHGIKPSEVVYRGHDLMTWAAGLMKYCGISFEGHFNEAPQPDLFSEFNILRANNPTDDPDAPVSYYENLHVPIIRYKNFELVRVN